MNTPGRKVWTDIDLVPEARGMLAGNGLTPEFVPGGSLEGVGDASAIIAGSSLEGDAALFALAPFVRVIARSGIGHERIDLAAATAAGVCAVNTPDAPTESTAEFAVALMLAVARRLPGAAVALAGGKWISGGSLVGFDLEGKTLGLAGCGRIGRRVAEIARSFRMQVQAFDPYAASVPDGVRRVPALSVLLASSDIVSLHMPLGPETRHIICSASLAQFRRGAILINTSRGPLVDETALFEALRSGHLAGAGIDVWDPEPPEGGNPLLGLVNVVATPHMAAFTTEGRRRSHTTAAAQVLSVLNGTPPAYLLNPEVWERRRNPAS